MVLGHDLPTVHKDGSRTLVAQIVDHYLAAIETGRLAVGDRLPTIRAVASAAGITRATVQQAYRQLAARGLVRSTVGRGTQVAAGPAGDGGGAISRAARAAFAHLQHAVPVPSPPDGEVVANFGDLLPDAELFPVDEFRASIDRVLREQGGELLAYGDPTGDRGLRELLAQRHADAAGDPGRILITCGAQQGIDLVLRTFTQPGDAVAVSIPTYHQLFGVLKALGLELAPVPHHPAGPEHGIDLDALGSVLAQPAVRLLYVMPTFHNPTGHTLTRAQRERLMSVVAETSVPVLEDEFQCELRCGSEPLPTLFSLDRRGLTATVRSFSKGLFPGARIGWVQAAPEAHGPMVALKQFCDLESSPVLQVALDDFIRRGAMDRYLDKLRQELRRRHAAALVALERYMPSACSWSKPDGGLALWLEMPPGIDAERVVEKAAERGVRATPGRVFDPLARPSSGIRLSLARAAVPAIERGVEIIASCARECEAAALDASSKPPLFF